MSFDDFFEKATGSLPYPWQRRVAHDGLPEVIDVPTGAGKTAAMALAWCWRRHQPTTRELTPRRLVWALPMRALVDQTLREIRRWLDRLSLADQVAVHVLMGGGEDQHAHPVSDRQRERERQAGRDWLLGLAGDAVIVGTIDMLLSRALNRGYVSSTFTWPVEFGVLSNDCHWVFDEVQLLGPALPASRQLQALRDALGTVGPSSSTWMSATLDRRALATVDNPVTPDARARWVMLGEHDRVGELARRLGAAKTVREVPQLPTRGGERAKRLADVLAAKHRPGTLTLAVLNTVRSAQALWRELDQRALDAEICLLHARFRAAEREAHERRALAAIDPTGPGRIAICTQVIEAGIDCSAAVLFTEVAPWPSIVQRAGRCNREGDVPDALLLWAEPLRPWPYAGDEVAVARDALRRLDGRTVTPESIRDVEVPSLSIVHPVLRRRDLIELFDTAPDLTGNLIDVTHLIRSVDEVDAYVCWRGTHDRPLTAASLEGQDPPRREELCPVPIGDLREWARSKGRLFWRDHVRGAWVPIAPDATRTGQVYVVDVAAGGYSEALGWDLTSVQPVTAVSSEPFANPADADDDVGADPASFRRRRWVRLTRHLADVRDEARDMVAHIGLSSDDPLMAAVIEAARLHDVGKVHPVFQDTMQRAAPEEHRAQVASSGPWAKSAGSASHSRPAFRHELVSALQVIEAVQQGVLRFENSVDPDLVAYLVGAHHGRVRLGIRALPRELESAGVGDIALGVVDGDLVPPVDVPGGWLPACTMRLRLAALGRDGDSPSWTERALCLLDRLGPFRLAYAEALVRIADWRASAAEEHGPDDLHGLAGSRSGADETGGTP